MNAGILDTIRNYLRVSGNIADQGGKNFLFVLARIIAFRAIYGMGPDTYDRRRFANKKLRQAHEYLTLRERENLQKSLCPVESRELAENKLRFYGRCLEHGLPTPAVYGWIRFQDAYVPQGMPVIRSGRELKEFIGRLPSGKYIVKPINAGHGWGISAIQVDNGKISDFSGNCIEIEQFYQNISENRFNSAGYMFQEFIRPHPDLRPIMPGPGVGTFRIVTFLMGERSVEIPFAVAKIPVEGSLTDNFDGGYSGNWVCPVDVKTGCLGNAVGKSDAVPVFSEIEKREDTGATFRGTVVPLWKEVKSTVVKSALAFSDLRTIGWDVAVTDRGVSILEANWDWGENLIEVAHNRGLRFELTNLTKKSLQSCR